MAKYSELQARNEVLVALVLRAAREITDPRARAAFLEDVRGAEPAVFAGLSEAEVEKLGGVSRERRLSFDDLRRANVERCEAHYHPVDAWSLPDWMTAVAGEVGELAGVVKNIRRRDEEGGNAHAIGPDGPEELADEAADVAIYLDLLCARAGVDLGAAVRRKFNRVSDERLGSPIRLGAKP